jgi:hypothetical protein
VTRGNVALFPSLYPLTRLAPHNERMSTAIDSLHAVHVELTQ